MTASIPILVLNRHHLQQIFRNTFTNGTFPELLSIKTEAGTPTLESFSHTVDLKLKQEPVMNSQENEFSASEITLWLFDERIKQATDPIFRQVEESYALLASRDEMKSTGNNEATGSRRDNTSASPLSNRRESDRISRKFI